jgi:hypothetical protein
MYLVTCEDDEDGFWIDEPRGFDTEVNARAYIKEAKEPPKNHNYVLYRCYEIPLKK